MCNTKPLLTECTTFLFILFPLGSRQTDLNILTINWKVLICSALVVFLFLAGLWFTGAPINGPNFHPKLTLGAPTIGYSVSCCVSCWLAQQDPVDGKTGPAGRRRMTNYYTALLKYKTVTRHPPNFQSCGGLVTKGWRHLQTNLKSTQVFACYFPSIIITIANNCVFKLKCCCHTSPV